MKCTIVGTKSIDFVSERDNKSVKGLQLHIVRDCSVADNSCEGKLVDTVFVRCNDNGTLAVDIPLPIACGREYEFFYDILPNRRNPVLTRVALCQK